MAKCIFCGVEQPDFKGTFLIKNDGTTVYYCSTKCRKNHLKLKRDKRKLKWTEAFHLTREKKRGKDELMKDKIQADRDTKKARKSVRKASKSSSN